MTLWRIAEVFMDGMDADNQGWIGWSVAVSNIVAEGASVRSVTQMVPPSPKHFSWLDAQMWWRGEESRL